MKRNPIPRRMAEGRKTRRELTAAYGDKTANLQNAIVELLTERGASGAPNVHMNSMRSGLARMAASPDFLTAIRYAPVAAVAPAINFAENESYANQAMDLLGMGAGAYGMHKGLVGRATAGLPVNRNLATAAVVGAGAAGMAGSDLIQLLVGGGRG